MRKKITRRQALKHGGKAFAVAGVVVAGGAVVATGPAMAATLPAPAKKGNTVLVYNWNTGKSEKCILCYPRLEAGQAPACMHSCVGRIRYLGVMLYDADRIKAIASADESELVDLQLEMLLDPFDEEVIAAAKKNGVSDSTLKAAQRSPVYKFVKEWGLALPLHPEFRTLPMLFYVPPLLPVMASITEVNNTDQAKKLNPISKHWTDNWLYDTTTEELWGTIEQVRFPIKYMANMFSAGDESKVIDRLKKLMAVRIH